MQSEDTPEPTVTEIPGARRRAGLIVAASLAGMLSFQPEERVILLAVAGFALLYWLLWRFMSRPGAVRIPAGLNKIVVFGARLPTWLFLALTAGVFLSATLIVASCVFDGIPVTGDGAAYSFQAKIFLLGKTHVPAPPLEKFFRHVFIVSEQDWLSQYPPGFPAFLALGMSVGLRRLVNPLFGVGSVILIYLLGVRVTGSERGGRLAAFLAACSPFTILQSAAYMSHPGAMFFAALFLVAYFSAVAHEHRRLRDYLAMGSAAAALLLIRPGTAAAFTFPFCVFFSVALLLKKVRARNLAVFALPLLLGGAGLLWYNRVTNGDPLLFGYVRLYGPGHSPGFGHSGWGPPHTPLDGLRYTVSNIANMNLYLFGWPIPSLFFFMVLLVSGKLKQAEWVALAAVLSIMLLHFAYFFHDNILGPRFYYCLVPLTIVFSVKGLLAFPATLRERVFRATEGELERRTMLAVAAFTFVALAAFSPMLINFQARERTAFNAAVIRAVEKQKIDNAVIFIDRNYPYQNAFWLNDPALEAGNLYVRDRQEENPSFLREFPARQVYRFVYDPKEREGVLEKYIAKATPGS